MCLFLNSLASTDLCYGEPIFCVCPNCLNFWLTNSASSVVLVLLPTCVQNIVTLCMCAWEYKSLMPYEIDVP